MGWQFNTSPKSSVLDRGEVSKVDVSRFVTQSSSTGKVPVIAILCPHSGTWSAEWCEKTWIPLKTRALPWCEKQFYLCRVPSLPLARNILVKEALKSNADFLFWLDSDMLPQSKSDPNDLLKELYDALVETGESIASGLYRAKQTHGFNFAMWQRVPPEVGKEGYVNIDKWTGNWIEVSVAGAGCLLMRRQVFEKMNQPYFSWELPDSKCIAPNQFVLGVSSIDEIKPLDSIFNLDGRISIVGNIHVKSDKTELISILTTGTNIPLQVTPEHNILTLSKFKKNRIQKYDKISQKTSYCSTKLDLSNAVEQWVNASQLHEGDYVGFPIISDEINVSEIKLEFSKFMRNKTLVPQIIPINDDFMEVLGLWLAEGSTGLQGSVDFSFSSKEQHLADKVIAVLHDKLGISYRTVLRHEDHVLNLTFNCNPLAKYLRKTFGSDARNKHIPNWILTLPRSRLIPYLRGFWLGDGFKSYNGENKDGVVGTNIASRDLAYQLYALLVKLGIRPTIRYYKSYSDKTFGNDIYQIKIYEDASLICKTLKLPYDINPRHVRHTSRFFYNGKLWSRVKNININSYNGLVFDLTIPNGNSYVVNNVITHNSEDFDMLEKAKSLGFKTWVLTTNLWEHEARVVLDAKSGTIRVPSV